ncbi:MAG: hypothetical protein AB1815_06255 [Bacillota bacterium]
MAGNTVKINQPFIFQFLQCRYGSSRPECRFQVARTVDAVELHLHKASSPEEMLCLANRLIGVFEQCTKADELKVKQGSYFQMANLYIMLQDFDKAQAMLNQIPMQTVIPAFC